MTQHTPGPWKVMENWRGKLRIMAGNIRIANCPGGNNSDPKKQAQGVANAHLIAAAPAMLAALEKAANFIAEIQRQDGGPVAIPSQINDAIAAAKVQT